MALCQFFKFHDHFYLPGFQVCGKPEQGVSPNGGLTYQRVTVVSKIEWGLSTLRRMKPIWLHFGPMERKIETLLKYQNYIRANILLLLYDFQRTWDYGIQATMHSQASKRRTGPSSFPGHDLLSHTYLSTLAALCQPPYSPYGTLSLYLP